MKTSKWILLAEDDPQIAELTMFALAPEDLACEVLVVPDGQAALDCIYHRGEFLAHAGGQPLFVLLDLKMPKVDGLEVLRQIKSDPQLKNIPVVIFSSSREPSDIVHSYELGVNAYVVKPVDFQQFNDTVKNVRRFWAETNEPPAELPPVTVAVELAGDEPLRAAAGAS
jgi:CheY-like chemotaxis protein